MRLRALEGLRGVLAWWVVGAHVLSLSGVRGKHSVLAFFRDGDCAVRVFIVLSGFVIFTLLTRRDLTYWQFLGQRFARLYPAFLCCFLIGIVLFPLERSNWQSALQRPDKAAHYAAMHASWAAHFGAHVVASTTFVHGVLPRSLLPFAPFAFLQPGWSVALEWQFYLLAPVIFCLVANERRIVQVVGATVLVAVALLGERMASYNGAALPVFLRFFLVGIGSFYLSSWARRRPSGWWSLGALLPPALDPQDPALWIWGAVFATVLAPTARISSLARRLLESGPVVRMGTVSYSTYVAHWPLLTLTTYLLTHLFRGIGSYSAAAVTFVIAAPLIYGVSELLYRFVESPGIALGKRWTARWARYDPAS